MPRARACDNVTIPFYANAHAARRQSPDLDRHGDDRSRSPSRPHHRGRARRHRRRTSSPWPRRRSGSCIRTTQCSTAWMRGTRPRTARTGLIAKVKASDAGRGRGRGAGARLSARSTWPAKASPMCGNSICQDRRFLARWMPALEDWFHYRNLDVSTLKELVPALEAGAHEGHPEGRQARGAGRRARVDRRVAGTTASTSSAP